MTKIVARFVDDIRIQCTKTENIKAPRATTDQKVRDSNSLGIVSCELK